MSGDSGVNPSAGGRTEPGPAAPEDTAAPPLLELRAITKAYPGVVANDAVDLTVRRGEIHAVLGENGAGKSTLMKIIYGVVRADAGVLLWQGRPESIRNPAQARELGIGMVFQHFSLFETLTVAQNVALALPGRLERAALGRRIVEVSERYGLPVDPRRLVHSLSVGERQRVEIVRCLLQEPKLLIMDEPTSVLTPQAVDKLFATLRRLAAEGCSILYISHKLDEIQRLCHRATVLRDGRVTGTCDPSQETPQTMARMMIGHEIPVCRPPPASAGGAPLLAVAGLSHAADDPFGVDLRDVHFEVRAGEILGIAGVSGNGQQELLATLSGEERLAERFPIRIAGHEIATSGAGRRRRLGLAYVPEERLGKGAVPEMSLAENALLTGHRTGLVRFGMIDRRRARELAQRCIDAFDVRSAGPQAEAKSLSGGNLQKFIVGRELLLAPRVLVVAQPTWGVDVGAAAFIRQALVDLRNAGAAILIVSEELDELFEVCDRIAVLAKGRLSPARRIEDTSVEEIGVWMSGLWPGAEAPARARD